eukprot:3720047-Pyramimonas_sp.AAC.1
MPTPRADAGATSEEQLRHCRATTLNRGARPFLSFGASCRTATWVGAIGAKTLTALIMKVYTGQIPPTSGRRSLPDVAHWSVHVVQHLDVTYNR